MKYNTLKDIIITNLVHLLKYQFKFNEKHNFLTLIIKCSVN